MKKLSVTFALILMAGAPMGTSCSTKRKSAVTECRADCTEVDKRTASTRFIIADSFLASGAWEAESIRIVTGIDSLSKTAVRHITVVRPKGRIAARKTSLRHTETTDSSARNHTSSHSVSTETKQAQTPRPWKLWGLSMAVAAALGALAWNQLGKLRG